MTTAIYGAPLWATPLCPPILRAVPLRSPSDPVTMPGPSREIGKPRLREEEPKGKSPRSRSGNWWKPDSNPTFRPGPALSARPPSQGGWGVGRCVGGRTRESQGGGVSPAPRPAATPLRADPRDLGAPDAPASPEASFPNPSQSGKRPAPPPPARGGASPAPTGSRGGREK